MSFLLVEVLGPFEFCDRLLKSALMPSKCKGCENFCSKTSAQICYQLMLVTACKPAASEVHPSVVPRTAAWVSILVFKSLTLSPLCCLRL
jgi:hypothetical protein